MPSKLHLAAGKENGLAEVKKLIEEGADVNFVDPELETTPIAFALQTGDLDTIKYLIEEKNVSLDTSKSKHSLLDLAVQNSSDVINYVTDPANKFREKFNDGTTELHMAVVRGEAAKVVELIKKDPDSIWKQNKKGQNAFYWLGVANASYLVPSFLTEKFLRDEDLSRWDMYYRGLLYSAKTSFLQKRESYNLIHLKKSDDYLYLADSMQSEAIQLSEDSPTDTDAQSLTESVEYYKQAIDLYKKVSPASDQESDQLQIRLSSCYVNMFMALEFDKNNVEKEAVLLSGLKEWEKIKKKNDAYYKQLVDLCMKLIDFYTTNNDFKQANIYVQKANGYANRIADPMQLRLIRNTLEEVLKILKIKEGLSQEAAKYGMKCEDVPADGDCLFSVVFEQIKRLDKYQHYTPHVLRQIAVAHMRANPDLYAPNMVDETFQQYLIKMARPGTWADHLTITALCRALGITMATIRSDGRPPFIFKPKQSTLTVITGFEIERHYQKLVFDSTKIATKFIQTEVDAAEVDIEKYDSIDVNAIVLQSLKHSLLISRNDIICEDEMSEGEFSEYEFSDDEKGSPSKKQKTESDGKFKLGKPGENEEALPSIQSLIDFSPWQKNQIGPDGRDLKLDGKNQYTKSPEFENLQLPPFQLRQ